MPGVFAAGDVRYRSVKRVAAAVGQGAAAIQQVHEYLTAEASTPRRSRAGDAPASSCRQWCRRWCPGRSGR